MNLSAGQAARPAPSPRLHQLPDPPAGFVGREDDSRHLRDGAGTGTVLIGLRGMGGIGKTALALVLAQEWKPRFPDAQLFLDGRGTHANPASAEALLTTAISAFLPDRQKELPTEVPGLRAIYCDLLQDKRVLVLLDNAHDAEQAAPLIPPAGCALIVTSRRGFMLGNRAAYSLEKLPDGEATALLREFCPTLAQVDATELVKLCAGLPLALKLAGSHLALDAGERQGVADVAGYLGKLRASRLGALDAAAPDAGEITITETLRLSEAQLAEPGREAWRKLGVFTASFDGRAARVIAGADEGTMGLLVRRSLVEREGDRYKLHDLAAEYARGQWAAAARAELLLTHGRHYATVGWEADGLYKSKDKAVDGLALFDRERAQIEAAFGFLSESAGLARAVPCNPGGRATSPESESARQLISLVNALAYVAELRFHPRQRIAWLEAQLFAAHLFKDRRSEGNALGNLGTAHYSLGHAHKAIEFHEQNLVIAREVGDRRGEAKALGNLGLAHWSLGDARKAIEFYGQALLIYREIGDRRGEGNALGNLGLAHWSSGDARRAIGFYEEQLVIVRDIGDLRGESVALGNLGNALHSLGDGRKAIEFYAQQLVIVRKIGDRRLEGIALWNSALTLDSLGNRAEAIPRARAALDLFEAIEDPNAAQVRARLAQWREGQPPPDGPSGPVPPK